VPTPSVRLLSVVLHGLTAAPEDWAPRVLGAAAAVAVVRAELRPVLAGALLLEAFHAVKCGAVVDDSAALMWCVHGTD